MQNGGDSKDTKIITLTTKLKASQKVFNTNMHSGTVMSSSSGSGKAKGK